MLKNHNDPGLSLAAKSAREVPDQRGAISFIDVAATWVIVVGALGLLLFSCILS